MYRRNKVVFCATALLLIFSIAFGGCRTKPPRSENYFGLVPGNSWLYEGSDEAQSLEIEIRVTKPDPSLRLREGIFDLSISGSLGNYKIGEEGLFLEVGEEEVKLWGVRKSGSPPQFFATPYVWLKKPIEVGARYNTSIKGTPSPSVMVVAGKTRVQTPWGELEGYLLQNETGSHGAVTTSLVFVEYFGIASANVPDLPPLKIKDAELK